MDACSAADLVVAHQFPLSAIAGTTVMLRALLADLRGLGVRVAYLDLGRHPEPETELARLFSVGSRPVFLGVNLQIEHHWSRSTVCLDCCRRLAVPAFVWVHDYWPHHRDPVRAISEEYGVHLLSSTDAVRAALEGDGFTAPVMQTGVPLDGASGQREARLPANPGRFVVGCAGRLVPRKRHIDLARGFALAGLGNTAELRMRLLPSLVYSSADDAVLLESLLRTTSAGSRLVVEQVATPTLEYGAYDVFVCCSEYEGLSMTPVEAVHSGCPVLMSDIPAHRRIACTLFPGDEDDVLFPLGDVEALAAVLGDEARTGRRRRALEPRAGQLRQTIEQRWSTAATARALLTALALDSREDAAGRSSGGVSCGC